MKKVNLLLLLLCVAFSATAQKTATPPYEFTDIKVNEISPLKNQSNTGTCWCFATIAFLESDLIKSGKGVHDLSEMWIVRQVYFDKVEKYIRMHGKNNLEQGGNAHDVPFTIAKIGIVPDSIYPGLNYGTKNHSHGELEALLKAYADVIISNPNRELTTAWKQGVDGILDAYFGVRPEKFTYQGKEYTPQSYAKSLGINPDDYITITSYTHHRFYTTFALEIPDNWAWGESYNVPMNEMLAINDEALNRGYTVGWNADVSEKGYKFDKGFAVLPQTDLSAQSDSDRARWSGDNDSEKIKAMYKFEAVVPEKVVTQKMRQEMFDNYTTTDDHSMQFYGIAKDQNGNVFYKTKNSWGSDSILEGSFYVSQPYMLAKTTTLTINKNALTKEMKAKLNIK